MSLLLDALKRAEEAKRAKLTAGPGSDLPDFRTIPPATKSTELPQPRKSDALAASKVEPPDFRLEDYGEHVSPKTLPRPPVSPKSEGDATQINELRLANLTEALQGRPVEKAPPASQSRLESTTADAAQSRDKARNVFAAKQPANSDGGPRKKWLLPAVAVLFVAIGAGSWFVWNEVNRMARPTGPSIASRPALALPAAQPQTGQPGAPQQEGSAPAAIAPMEPPLPPLLPPPGEQIAPPKPTVHASVASSSFTERETLAKSLKSAPISKTAPLELKPAVLPDGPKIDAELVDAYSALKSADYQRALDLYGKLAAADPLNIDAQLGLATAFARTRDPVSAVRHYRQVLIIDPRNGAALAGLLALRGASSPSMEVEIKTLVGKAPESSSLHFTLGNLYAGERRWVEAQQAYFEAYRLEPDNADYLFNLAVSLDQLKQTKLAMDYYQKSLTSRSRTGGQFDPAIVSRRIADLSTASRSN